MCLAWDICEEHLPALTVTLPPATGTRASFGSYNQLSAFGIMVSANLPILETGEKGEATEWQRISNVTHSYPF